ncbi:unnamed protein product [Prorocentrum cordatum]|uniref:J domain-containing protein n=1 Tax=Prorocentrum cordatum TaxID=2364126 RepID=A0ABN9PF09_9DINO|nr:unnamed protein product [Polarella glacialis]
MIGKGIGYNDWGSGWQFTLAGGQDPRPSPRVYLGHKKVADDLLKMEIAGLFINADKSLKAHGATDRVDLKWNGGKQRCSAKLVKCTRAIKAAFYRMGQFWFPKGAPHRWERCLWLCQVVNAALAGVEAFAPAAPRLQTSGLAVGGPASMAMRGPSFEPSPGVCERAKGSLALAGGSLPLSSTSASARTCPVGVASSHFAMSGGWGVEMFGEERPAWAEAARGAQRPGQDAMKQREPLDCAAQLAQITPREQAAVGGGALEGHLAPEARWMPKAGVEADAVYAGAVADLMEKNMAGDSARGHGAAVKPASGLWGSRAKGEPVAQVAQRVAHFSVEALRRERVGAEMSGSPTLQAHIQHGRPAGVQLCGILDQILAEEVRGRTLPPPQLPLPSALFQSERHRSLVLRGVLRATFRRPFVATRGGHPRPPEATRELTAIRGHPRRPPEASDALREHRAVHPVECSAHDPPESQASARASDGLLLWAAPLGGVGTQDAGGYANLHKQKLSEACPAPARRALLRALAAGGALALLLASAGLARRAGAAAFAVPRCRRTRWTARSASGDGADGLEAPEGASAGGPSPGAREAAEDDGAPQDGAPDPTLFFGGVSAAPEREPEETSSQRVASRINQVLAMRRAKRPPPERVVETAWYDEIGVSPTATQEELKLAYLGHAEVLEEQLAYLLESPEVEERMDFSGELDEAEALDDDNDDRFLERPPTGQATPTRRTMSSSTWTRTPRRTPGAASGPPSSRIEAKRPSRPSAADPHHSFLLPNGVRTRSSPRLSRRYCSSPGSRTCTRFSPSHSSEGSTTRAASRAWRSACPGSTRASWRPREGPQDGAGREDPLARREEARVAAAPEGAARDDLQAVLGRQRDPTGAPAHHRRVQGVHLPHDVPPEEAGGYHLHGAARDLRAGACQLWQVRHDPAPVQKMRDGQEEVRPQIPEARLHRGYKHVLLQQAVPHLRHAWSQRTEPHGEARGHGLLDLGPLQAGDRGVSRHHQVAPSGDLRARHWQGRHMGRQGNRQDAERERHSHAARLH